MSEAITDADNLPADLIEAYRRDGFVKVPSIISRGEAETFRAAAEAAAARMKKMAYAGTTFDQCVNVWREDETMRRLTLHPNLAAVAEKLAGEALRLWHDQVLIKRPRVSTATEFHQDQPYWPHGNSPDPISCWVALVDVPAERGCMTFLPDFQRRDDLPEQDLQSAASLMELCPEMRWSERVTLPLRAGDCTFHHGRTPHMATPNLTDEARVAHVVIYVDAATVFTGAREHPVTDPLGLEPGQPLDGELFPAVSEMGRSR